MKGGKGKRPVKRTKSPVVAVEAAAVESAAVAVAPAVAMPRAQVARRAAWCLFSALLLVFYFWTATSSQRPFHPRNTSDGLYNQLTTAFQKGQLYIDTKPAPQLLALPDPYDPAANQPYRLHDASLYRGRYYVYFGAAPVVVLYLPWRMLTGSPLSDDVAVTVFCFGGYVSCCLLLFLLLDTSGVRPPWWLQAAVVLALGVGQFAPIVLRRPKMYEVAVSAAYCFLSGALYFGARRILKGDRQWTAAVSALLLGLAAGSRPNCGLAAAVMAAGYGFYLWRERKLRGRAWFGEFAPFLAPLAAVGLAIAWYNFARFGNPLEFGVTLQVGALSFYHSTPLPLKLRQMLASFYYLVLCLPNFKARFPFVELNGGAEPFGNPDLYPNLYFHEPTGGLLAMAPLCIAAVGLMLMRRRFDAPLRWVLGGLAACGLVMFAGLCAMVAGASGRYGLDFAPALLVTGIFVCLSVGGRAVRVATVAACLWSAVVNLGASVNSYGYPLERAPNTAYRNLVRFFGAGPEAITETIDGLHWEATVTFPHARPDSREPLLAAGIYEVWDLLFVQYVEGDKAMFAWVHCGISDKWGPWTPIKPGIPQHLIADYSRAAKRVTVKLDGAVVMDFPATFYPSPRDAISVGTMKLGRFFLRDFSGKLETTRLDFRPLR